MDCFRHVTPEIEAFDLNQSPFTNGLHSLLTDVNPTQFLNDQAWGNNQVGAPSKTGGRRRICKRDKDAENMVRQASLCMFNCGCICILL